MKIYKKLYIKLCFYYTLFFYKIGMYTILCIILICLGLYFYYKSYKKKNKEEKNNDTDFIKIEFKNYEMDETAINNILNEINLSN